jgi:dUTP pyrophosphatase
MTQEQKVGGMSVEVKVKLLRHDARVPVFAREGDACCDLCAGDEQDVTVVYGGETKLIYTAIALAIPPGFEGLVRARSGLTSRGIFCMPGVLDSGYRGRIGIVIFNSTREPFTVRRNDRIAQLAIRVAPEVKFTEVDELGETARADRGFGSTGG